MISNQYGELTLLRLNSVLILDPINSHQRAEICSISSNLKKAHTHETGSLKIYQFAHLFNEESHDVEHE
jgi:hypothetical protein